MKQARGFTLLEMVFVIVVASILAMAVSPLAGRALTSYEVTAASVQAQNKLRYAIERMAFEIRELTPGSIGTTLSSTSLTFSRVDYYNGASPSTITVKLAKNGSKLELSYSSPVVNGYTPVLTDQLSSLVFKYYDSTGTTETTNASNVRFIGIDLTLTATAGGASQTFSQHTLVALRNY